MFLIAILVALETPIALFTVLLEHGITAEGLTPLILRARR